jgi:hypothetical protein
MPDKEGEPHYPPFSLELTDSSKASSFFFPSRLSQGIMGQNWMCRENIGPYYRIRAVCLAFPTPARGLGAWPTTRRFARPRGSRTPPSVYIHAVISRTRPSPTAVSLQPFPSPRRRGVRPPGFRPQPIRHVEARCVPLFRFPSLLLRSRGLDVCPLPIWLCYSRVL